MATKWKSLSFVAAQFAVFCSVVFHWTLWQGMLPIQEKTFTRFYTYSSFAGFVQSLYRTHTDESDLHLNHLTLEKKRQQSKFPLQKTTVIHTVLIQLMQSWLSRSPCRSSLIWFLHVFLTRSHCVFRCGSFSPAGWMRLSFGLPGPIQ